MIADHHFDNVVLELTFPFKPKPSSFDVSLLAYTSLHRTCCRAFVRIGRGVSHFTQEMSDAEDEGVDGAGDEVNEEDSAAADGSAADSRDRIITKTDAELVRAYLKWQSEKRKKTDAWPAELFASLQQWYRKHRSSAKPRKDEKQRAKKTFRRECDHCCDDVHRRTEWLDRNQLLVNRDGVMMQSKMRLLFHNDAASEKIVRDVHSANGCMAC